MACTKLFTLLAVPGDDFVGTNIALGARNSTLAAHRSNGVASLSEDVRILSDHQGMDWVPFSCVYRGSQMKILASINKPFTCKENTLLSCIAFSPFHVDTVHKRKIQKDVLRCNFHKWELSHRISRWMVNRRFDLQVRLTPYHFFSPERHCQKNE